MSHELRKAMLTAISLVVIGGFFNTFNGDQRMQAAMPMHTNSWRLDNLSLMEGDSSFGIQMTRSDSHFNLKTPVAVVLVSFRDKVIQTQDAQWQTLIFGNQENSVYRYYQEVSQGTLELVPVEEASSTLGDGVISVTLPQNHPDNKDKLTADTYLAVVRSISQATSVLDLKAIDLNGNKTIEPEELIWIIVFAGYEDLYKKEGEVSSSGFSHDITYYGRVNAYTMTEFIQIGELYYDRYITEKSSITTQGILVHEMGHILGLPDLYDTDYSSQGVGLFSLMGNGDKLFKPRGRLGDQPADLDPWSKLYLKFAEPVVVIEPGEYFLHSNKWGKPDILLVPTGQKGQYFLIENRYLENRDSGLSLYAKPGGILIWHIDESVIFNHFYENTVNADETHKGIDLEESSETSLGYSQLDGIQRSELYEPFYRAKGVSVFDASSNPNSETKAKQPTGISITVLEDGYTAKIEIKFEK